MVFLKSNPTGSTSANQISGKHSQDRSTRSPQGQRQPRLGMLENMHLLLQNLPETSGIDLD